MKLKESISHNERILYFDVLRIIAILGVIILHIAASNYYVPKVTSFEWQVFNFFDSIVRWSVSVFVMISGALFLNSNNSTEKIYKKYILRIATAFLFWSIIYALINIVQGATIKEAIIQILEGHYHMWFSFMIVGLYMIVPFLKKIIESQKLIKYFLLLSLIFAIIIPNFLNILSIASPKYSSIIRGIVAKFNYNFTLGYVGYFVCGYYLSKINLSKKSRIIIYILSLLGFLSTIIATSMLSIHLNRPDTTFYNAFTLNVMLESLGVFVFFKYNISKIKFSPKIEKIILKLSKYSFGVYLVHAIIIEQLDKIFGFNTLSLNPIASVILITFIVVSISFIISWICNSIPKIKKYIV